jgi:hypothetical protein
MAQTLETPAGNQAEVITADFLANDKDLTEMDGVESRFDWAEIDETLWSQSYPYQLAVLEAGEGGSYSLFEQTVFTLPINPEDLTNAMPFAATVEATLGGVVEQHGGVPFRQIAFSGTMGVLPSRDAGTELTGGWLHEVQGIAGGTIQNARGTVAAARSAVYGPQFTPNLIQEPVENGTGYYQFRQLQRFLESYAEAKKTDAGQDLRLALLIWKEQAAYLVTPRLFQVRRSKDSPHEFRYSLQLQAWKRIDPNSIGQSAGANTFHGLAKPRGAAVARQILQRMDLARRTLAAARQTILAIRSDYDESVGQAVRQAALFLRDAVGLVKTAVDFPGQMRDHIAQDIRQSWDIIKGAVGSRTDPRERGLVESISARSSAQNSGAPPTDPADPIGLRAAVTDPANDWLHESIKPDSLPLAPGTRETLAEETARAAALTKGDFKDMHQQVLAFLAGYADRVGLGSATYNATMGFSTAAQVRDTIDEDYAVLGTLTEVAQALSQVSAFGSDFQPRTPTTIEYAAGLANAAGIAMRVPRSKFAVPFPYQGSLERLAQQYLGDSKRWFEIASLNDLRAPYVDEVGVIVPLLVNGKANEVVIADAKDLVLGQTVTLSSNAIDPVTRVVLNTVEVAPGYWVVTLNGDPDLSQFLVGDVASVQYFAQHTVHGGQVIYIPSDQVATVSTPFAPTAADLTRLLQAGDVDGLLTESGDIAIQPNGEWPFVFGLASIIQWTRVALSTPLGSMVLHPDFGFPLAVGQSLADVSAADVLKGLQSMFRSGPSFTGVRSAAVDIAGPAARVSFELAVRGLDARIPISFDLKR